MGVFHPDLVGIQVRALQRLGAEHAVVVYGRDGMDEVSLGAATMVGELKDGAIREYEIHPEDFGLTMASNRALKVETPERVEGAAAVGAGQRARPGARHRAAQRRRGAVRGQRGAIDGRRRRAGARGASASGKALAKLRPVRRAARRSWRLTHERHPATRSSRSSARRSRRRSAHARSARRCARDAEARGATARLRRRAARARSPPASAAVIAEVKKASPSKGVLREHFVPAEIAAQLRARTARPACPC